MPTVSVIIPTYNSADLVVDAIDSVLEQTYKDYEIVVVDDGSTDSTREVVTAYGNKVKYIYQENLHISAARNHGFKRSSGKYIANLDADDLWLPDKLQKQVELFARNPEAAFVYCDGYIRTLDEKSTGDILASELYPAPRSGSIFEYIFRANPVMTSSALISRAVWSRAGGLDTNIHGGQDFEFLARLSALGPVFACEEPLMVYRRHSRNTSSRITSSNVGSTIRRNARVRKAVVKNLKRSGMCLPLSITFFDLMPEIIQHVMILWWRIRYGGSIVYTVKCLAVYMKKLLTSLAAK